MQPNSTSAFSNKGDDKFESLYHAPFELMFKGNFDEVKLNGLPEPTVLEFSNQIVGIPRADSMDFSNEIVRTLNTPAHCSNGFKETKCQYILHWKKKVSIYINYRVFVCTCSLQC